MPGATISDWPKGHLELTAAGADAGRRAFGIPDSSCAEGVVNHSPVEFLVGLKECGEVAPWFECASTGAVSGVGLFF